MKPIHWRRALGVILFAVFAFGGSFSEFSCHTDNVSVHSSSSADPTKK